MNSMIKSLAIIPDGNRRWSRENGLSLYQGYTVALKKLKEIVNYSIDKVFNLTIYTFSIENWKRSRKEQLILLILLRKLLRSVLEDKGHEINFKDIKVNFIGQIESMPPDIVSYISQVQEKTKNNKKINLNIALSYTGRYDIVNAVKKIVNSGIEYSEIDEQVIKKNLLTSGIPSPEIMIRTAADLRLSNFLLWDLAYTELFFPKCKWPDFTVEDFNQIIQDFKLRNRRYGR